MPNGDSSQFDRKLEEILRHAAAAFCERGYHQASIREIAHSTGASLAGLYYYFRSKDELLYLIQRHTFETILSEARATLPALRNPVERLRAFIRLHLKFFLEHPNEMKVLTHEADSLRNAWRREVNALKKSYYRLCFDQVEALKQERKLKGLNTRLAVLSLFGMMNWIYTWYRPEVDPDAGAMAEQMAAIFVRGIYSARVRPARLSKESRAASRRNGSRQNGRARPASPQVAATDRGREISPRPQGRARASRSRRALTAL